jgi:excisionase family DNA binding protein
MEEVWGSNPHSSTLSRSSLTRVFTEPDSRAAIAVEPSGATSGASCGGGAGERGHRRTAAGTKAGTAAHLTGMQKRVVRVVAATKPGPDVAEMTEQLDRVVSGLAALRDQLGQIHAPGPALPTALLLSPEDAAVMFGVGRSTVYRLMESGDLRRVSIGRCTRIPRADLERYIGQLLGRTA